jgi:hypothetical protein
LRDDNSLRFPIVPIGNPHLIEVKYEFRGTTLDVFMKSPDCFLQETTRNFQALGFLRDTLAPTSFIQLSSKKGIDSITGD